MPPLNLNQLKDDALPVSKPIRSLDELSRWSPDEDDGWNVSNVSLRERPVLGEDEGRMVVCHDMAGGMFDALGQRIRYCCSGRHDGRCNWVLLQQRFRKGTPSRRPCSRI